MRLLDGWASYLDRLPTSRLPSDRSGATYSDQDSTPFSYHIHSQGLHRRLRDQGYRVVDRLVDQRPGTARSTLQQHRIENAGLDADNLPVSDPSKMNFGSGSGNDAKAWKDIWGCGQGIGSITEIQLAADLITKFKDEFRAAVDAFDERVRVRQL